MNPQLAKQRFIDTFKIVSREKYHLSYSRDKLFDSELSTERLASLDDDPELAETIEAFASRIKQPLFCKFSYPSIGTIAPS